ncbi:unnamed protein product [Allacma fusca]|uniref:Uncharacterized protein n=1 Tax=Allacma fusca TaxID=39272 RepID=A0A8J2L0U4_9HEXA|nr:unnamed protein product [Allacma fusca]
MFEVDLADRVDDLICIFEALLKYVYRNFVKRGAKAKEEVKVTSVTKDSTKEISKEKTKSSQLSQEKGKPKETASSAGPAEVNNVSVNQSTGRTESTAVRRRRLDREQFSQSFDLSDKNKGPCNGPDTVVVEYVNGCHEWLYSPQTLECKEWCDVRESFIDSINKTLREDEKTNPTVASVVDIIFKDDMTMTNCFAECEHENTVKVTCDCEAKMTGVLSLYSPEKGTSRYDFFVDRLCGRLNILLDADEEAAIVKFDGWPEICVGIASNKKTNQLDSKLSESIAEKLTAAIRNAVFEVELKRFQDFPKAPKITPKRKVLILMCLNTLLILLSN